MANTASYKDMETKMFQLGFVEGVRATRAETTTGAAAAAAAGKGFNVATTTRSARLRRKQEAYEKKTDALLEAFVRTNADKLADFLPTATTANATTNNNPFLQVTADVSGVGQGSRVGGLRR